MLNELYFIIPGDLATLTGGYIYDRRLLLSLRAQGLAAHHVQLPGHYPRPTAEHLVQAEQIFADLPDDALVLVDGLAYGVLTHIAARERERLRLIELCHHPLALETGLSDAEAAELHESEGAALEHARAVVVTSKGTARLLRELFGVEDTKITVALPGTEPQDFSPCGGDPPLLLTVASLTKRKAHHILIAALAQLRHLPWRARFVGGAHFDPEWSAALRQQVVEAGLNERIEFVAEKQDLRVEYHHADLFVLPSLFEGYGMVFSEALAAGLPIVAARAGAVPEVVPPDAGILVPPGEVQALATALQELLTNPERRRQLQRGARAAAAGLPRWDDTARIVRQVLEAVAE